MYWLKESKDIRGREQRGSRPSVVVQSDLIPRSTVLVAPTSRSGNWHDFHPEVDVKGQRTRVLVEQTRMVDPQRLGSRIGRLSVDSMKDVEEALATVLALRVDRSLSVLAEGTPP